MSFAPQDVLRRKHRGLELSPAEIAAFVRGIGDGTVLREQIGAFTTSVLLNGMTSAETAALMIAMRDSGEVLDWAAAHVPIERVVEKHSSGGVGDEKLSPLTVTIASSAGVRVPNLTAGGLDYIPGEADLLEAIPGFSVALGRQALVEQIVSIGGAIMVPTGELAPADGAIYAVRSLTATVESIPLITASIMSKKLAMSPAAIVMSVGYGSGAFMPDVTRARELAVSMQRVCRRVGVAGRFCLADFNAVVGASVGGAVETLEMVEFLRSPARADARLREFTIAMSAELILAAGVAGDLDAARQIALEHLTSGRALRQFQAIVTAQGGPHDFVDRPRDSLPRATVVAPVFPQRRGYVRGMDCAELGFVLVDLGGARKNADGWMDHAVGLEDIAAVGVPVGPEMPLLILHAQSEGAWQHAAERIRGAFALDDQPAAPAGPVITEWLAP
jgi:thymidine phosphorylase